MLVGEVLAFLHRNNRLVVATAGVLAVVQGVELARRILF